MSTRATNNELLPIVDPEQLIRAARAATRKSKLVAASEARVAVIKATSQARKSRRCQPGTSQKPEGSKQAILQQSSQQTLPK
ncbi:hypothetical protein KEM48_001735 [Puccinia striiformis f. sp. tritici PST-130]|nr:hypothetical protein KEM48_001735 [Puccinia striiformis f. sp. tritici PST-130]